MTRRTTRNDPVAGLWRKQAQRQPQRTIRNFRNMIGLVLILLFVEVSSFEVSTISSSGMHPITATPTTRTRICYTPIDCLHSPFDRRGSFGRRRRTKRRHYNPVQLSESSLFCTSRTVSTFTTVPVSRTSSSSLSSSSSTKPTTTTLCRKRRSTCSSSNRTLPTTLYQSNVSDNNENNIPANSNKSSDIDDDNDIDDSYGDDDNLSMSSLSELQLQQQPFYRSRTDNTTVTEEDVMAAVEYAEQLWAQALEARKTANALSDRAEEEAEASEVRSKETEAFVQQNKRTTQSITMEQLVQVDAAAKSNLDASVMVNRALRATDVADHFEVLAEDALRISEEWLEQHIKDYPNSPLAM
jgi:hypothetical protein